MFEKELLSKGATNWSEIVDASTAVEGNCMPLHARILQDRWSCFGDSSAGGVSFGGEKVSIFVVAVGRLGAQKVFVAGLCSLLGFNSISPRRFHYMTLIEIIKCLLEKYVELP